MQRSNSFSTVDSSSSIVLPSSRCIKHTSSLSALKNNNNHLVARKKIWRSPRHYEIPDILGNAYLKPELPVTSYDLRLHDPSKRVSKRPWYPPNPHYEAPQVLPLTDRKMSSPFDSDLERTLRKMKLRVRNRDPRRQYSHFHEIGTGVNGAVLRARLIKKPHVQVAIKRCILHPDRRYRAAIVRELCIMATRHPNLIRLRQVVIWREDVWISMDLMRCSVFAVLCRRGIPEEHAVYITFQTLKALEFLHSLGYLHRDIKCENILLSHDGHVKLADFGLSASTRTKNCERLGTNKWMAPELIRRQPYNEKIDMWSLGITIIEMMDRVPPHYMINDEQALFETIVRQTGPTFTYSYPSIYMRGLVAWLLDHNPQARPRANDVLLELELHIKSDLLPCGSSERLKDFLDHTLEN
ncbi:kinase-like domain-containing protein [Dichotomocladium elegans]|nr:kinase-like domain-containing protein [Dichotomocladium elegans]